MTFTCPHLDPTRDWCLLLRTDCVPGRPGCVLRRKSTFLVPVEERIRLAAEAREARERAEGLRPNAPDGATQAPA